MGGAVAVGELSEVGLVGALQEDVRSCGGVVDAEADAELGAGVGSGGGGIQGHEPVVQVHCRCAAGEVAAALLGAGVGDEAGQPDAQRGLPSGWLRCSLR